MKLKLSELVNNLISTIVLRKEKKNYKYRKQVNAKQAYTQKLI